MKTILAKCIAYDENGSLCRQPAPVLDKFLGGYVCEKHDASDIAEILRRGGKCGSCGVRGGECSCGR